MNGLLTLAFAAGMIAPVNPCGFALLPAWITSALGDTDTSPLPVRLGRALRSGVALTLGFAGTLAAAGLVVSAGARALISAAPWLGLATGVILLLLGLAGLTGRTLTLRLPASGGRAAEGPPTARRMAVFGIGYAAASLSCTFGVLLAVIAQAQATASCAGLLLLFAVYAAGSATVLLLISLTTAAAGSALTRKVTALARYGPRVTAAVLVLTGAYLTWYWWTPATAGSTSMSTTSGALAGFSATASVFIQAHTTILATLAALAVLAVITAYWRHHRRVPAPRQPASGCCTANDDTAPAAAPAGRPGEEPCCTLPAAARQTAGQAEHRTRH